MFTGIVEATGEVAACGPGRLEIYSDLPVAVGESIAVDGVCLTAISISDGIIAAELSEETLSRSTLSNLHPGDKVNLERPLAATGRFGGHIVQGHVDGVGQIIQSRDNGGSRTLRIQVAEDLLGYLAVKGSVAVDGVSLTVSTVQANSFSVDLIPFTLTSTTLGNKSDGELVNLETDVLAKYVESVLKGRQ